MGYLPEIARRSATSLAVWTVLAGFTLSAVAADCCLPPEPTFQAQASDAGSCGVSQVADGYPAQQAGQDTASTLCPASQGGDGCSNTDGCPAIKSVSHWAFWADGGGMLRSPEHSVNFAVLNPAISAPGAAPAVVVSTADLDYDFATSGTFGVACGLSDTLQVEGMYTGTVPTSNSQAARDNTPNTLGGIGNLFSPFSDFGAQTPINGLDYNKFAAIDYTSAFHSVELNLRRQVTSQPWDGAVSLLFGIRYVGLPEDLSYQTESDITSSGAVVPNGAINNIHVAASNEMLGAQIGCLCEFWEANGWCLNVGAKAALLNNHCGETSGYVNIDNGATTSYFSSQSGNHSSLAGELNVSLSHRWSPHFTGILGYQALWLTGTALAQDNFNTNIAFYTSLDTQLAHSTLITYNEIYVGAQLDW